MQDDPSPEELPSTDRHAGQSKRRRSLPVRCLFIASIIPFAAGVLSFFGRQFFLAELLVNFQLQLAAILLSSFLVMMLFGYRKWAFLQMVLALILALPLAAIYLPGERPVGLQNGDGKRQIRVMSFNVYTTNHTPEKAIKCIRQTNPDVLIVVEHAATWEKAVEDLFELFPHRALQPRWHGFGISVLSKFPLSDTKVIQLVDELTDAPLISTQVDCGGKNLHLVATHLLAPMDPFRMKTRNRQLTEITTLLGPCSEPTIVAGDFNGVPWSSFMAQFLTETKLRDSRQGYGYHASWPAYFLPMQIPIDHAFVSEHIEVRNRQLLGQTGSDHFPMVVDISF